MSELIVVFIRLRTTNKKRLHFDRHCSMMFGYCWYANVRFYKWRLCRSKLNHCVCVCLFVTRAPQFIVLINFRGGKCMQSACTLLCEERLCQWNLTNTNSPVDEYVSILGWSYETTTHTHSQWSQKAVVLNMNTKFQTGCYVRFIFFTLPFICLYYRRYIDCVYARVRAHHKIHVKEKVIVGAKSKANKTYDCNCVHLYVQLTWYRYNQIKLDLHATLNAQLLSSTIGFGGSLIAAIDPQRIEWFPFEKKPQLSIVTLHFSTYSKRFVLLFFPIPLRCIT